MPNDNSSQDPDNPRSNNMFGWISRLAGGNQQSTGAIAASLSSAVSPSPSEMRLRIADFEKARVRDVMIPRVEVAAVDVETPLDELLRIFAETSHSRMPVYRDGLDDPIGFVHIKDVVQELTREGGVEDLSSERPLMRLKREILFVPASMRLSDLLVRMQTTRIHLALVVDEYGGTDGLVSLEDLVEQIVGEIEDEHDEDDAFIVARKPGLWDVDARAEIEDLEVETGRSLSLPDFEDDIDTLGGLVFALAGRVPLRGEIVEHPAGVDFEIVDADLRRIKKLRVRSGGSGGDKQEDKAEGTANVGQ